MLVGIFFLDMIFFINLTQYAVIPVPARWAVVITVHYAQL
jgi:hypothetical protein